MTIEPFDNDHDLETLEVATPGRFAVGDTMKGRAAFRDWLVHFRDPTTSAVSFHLSESVRCLPQGQAFLERGR